MIDRRRKKSSVNAPTTQPDFANLPVTSWQSIFDEIFAPCLEFPSGNLYGPNALNASASRLIETFENLELFELTSHETRDVQRFIDSYRIFLCNLDNGPGAESGRRAKIVQDRELPHKIFAKIGFDLMDGIEAEIRRISATSVLAQDLRANTGEQLELEPKIKDSIKRTTAIASALTELSHFSELTRSGRFNKGSNTPDDPAHTKQVSPRAQAARDMGLAS